MLEYLRLVGFVTDHGKIQTSRLCRLALFTAIHIAYIHQSDVIALQACLLIKPIFWPICLLSRFTGLLLLMRLSEKC